MLRPRSPPPPSPPKTHLSLPPAPASNQSFFLLLYTLCRLLPPNRPQAALQYLNRIKNLGVDDVGTSVDLSGSSPLKAKKSAAKGTANVVQWRGVRPCA